MYFALWVPWFMPQPDGNLYTPRPLAAALYSPYISNHALQNRKSMQHTRMLVGAYALTCACLIGGPLLRFGESTRRVQHAFYGQSLWLDMGALDQARRCYSWGATPQTRSCWMCRPLRLRLVWRPPPLPRSSPGMLWTPLSLRAPWQMIFALRRAQKARTPPFRTCKYAPLLFLFLNNWRSTGQHVSALT